MLGPFATASRLTPIHQMSLAVLSRAACASMSTSSQRRQRRQQRQRVTKGTAMAPWNGPNNMLDFPRRRALGRKTPTGLMTVEQYGAWVVWRSGRSSSSGGVPKWRDAACYELASVTEHATNVIKSLTTCSLSAPSTSSSSSPPSATTASSSLSATRPFEREQHLYQSSTHSIELRLAPGSQAHRRLGRFLIKYEGTSWTLRCLKSLLSKSYTRTVVVYTGWAKKVIPLVQCNIISFTS